MIIFFSAIPALQPIIHDLFVLRTASGSEIGGDLETQREVVVSMLLRLVHYPEVGWNVSWLVRRSDSKNLDQAFGWLVCRLLSQFLSFRCPFSDSDHCLVTVTLWRSISWPANQLVNISLSQSANRSVSKSADRLVSQSISQ